MKIISRLKNSDFVRDIGITTLGQVFVMVLTFLLNKVISMRFGPTRYMEYSLIHKTAGVITYVMILSLGIAIPRFISIYRAKKEKNNEYICMVASFILVIISSLIVFSICIFFREQFAKIVFGKETKYLAFVFPTLLLALQMGLTTLLYSYYRGTDRFFMYSISQGVVSLLLLMVSVIANELLNMIYIMSILGLLYSIIAFFFSYRQYKKAGCYIDNKELKSQVITLSKYSIPRVPGEFILFSFTTVPLILINQKLGPEKAVAFSVSLGIISAISPFFRYIGMVLLPYASKSMANNKIKDLESKIKLLSLVYLVISVVGMAFVLIFTKFVILVLYSSEYLPYIPIVKVMIFSLLPNAIYLLLRNPLDALSKFPINTINLIISFLVMNLIIYFSNSELVYALSFFIAYTILGVLSWISWLFLKKKISDKFL